MSNILNDITEDIDIKVKPNKTQFYFKWIIRFIPVIIFISFSISGVYFKYKNDINEIVKIQKNHENSINEIKNNINLINNRIDNVYDDGYYEFIEYQNYVNKQFLLILDYGIENKEFLKNLFEINSVENTKKIENKIILLKNKNNYKNN